MGPLQEAIDSIHYVNVSSNGTASPYRNIVLLDEAVQAVETAGTVGIGRRCQGI